ncbi:MAG: hypothetical protein DRJ59_06870, partial [Thermoprotei archaeon]
PEQVRNCIIHYYKEEHVRWVLLVGDADYDENPGDSNTPPTYSYDKEWEIPTRYVWNPRDFDWDDEYDTFFTPTDYYYAGLDGDWDDDGDGYFGESAWWSTVDEADWTPDVWVGRLPARTETEVTNMVNKIIKFEQTHPVIRDMLLLGAQLDYWGPTYGSTCKEHLVKRRVIPTYVTTHKYYQEGGSLSWTSVVDAINAYDPTLVSSASHGSETGLWLYGDGTFVDTSTPDLLTNTGILWYAQACSSGAFDWRSDCLGEAMEKDPDGSTVNYIGATREAWYYIGEWYLSGLCGLLDVLFWEQFFRHGDMQPGPCLYLSKLTYVTTYAGDINWEIERQNILAYNLIGDPETPYGPVLVEAVIHLYPGWNLISLPVIPKSTKIEDVLEPIEGKWSEIWSYQITKGRRGAKGTWLWASGSYDKRGRWHIKGKLKTMEDGKGYWIYALEETYLVVRGYDLLPGPAVPPSYPVYEGWNLVGFKSRYEMLGEDYLGPASYSVVHVIRYDPTTRMFREVDLGSNFVPGEAYWMYFYYDDVIAPPAPP